MNSPHRSLSAIIVKHVSENKEYLLKQWLPIFLFSLFGLVFASWVFFGVVLG